MPNALKLPPFSALRGFEAAARLQSFRLAALELSLSPSAISHHIKQLEEFVGNALFERSHQGVTLTQCGQTYLADITPIFKKLEQATNTAKQIPHREQIILRSSPAFSARWLMPRLRRLKKCVPDTNLTLTTNETNTSNADIEFMCAFTSPPNKDDEVFLSSARSPVCSPQYLNENGGMIENPSSLQNHTLLREHQFDSWEEWFEIATSGHSIAASELWFDDGYASMNAAELGLGVQLGYLELLAAELSDGRLVKLFDQAVPKKTLFTLRMKSGWRDNPNIVSIRSWLMKEMQEAENMFSSKPFRPVL